MISNVDVVLVIKLSIWVLSSLVFFGYRRTPQINFITMLLQWTLFTVAARFSIDGHRTRTRRKKFTYGVAEVALQ
jgi:hypothetical protein